METTKRYSVTAFAKTSPTDFVQFVTTAPDYKTAWQNGRNDCRYGNTVERLNGTGTIDLRPSAYIVRDVQSLEKRQRKIVEPTVAQLIEYCAANDVPTLTKRQIAAYETLRDAINASDDDKTADADADADAA